MNGILRSQTRTWFHCKTVDVIVQSYIYNLNLFFSCVVIVCTSLLIPRAVSSRASYGWSWTVMGSLATRWWPSAKPFSKRICLHMNFSTRYQCMYVCMFVYMNEWMYVCMYENTHLSMGSAIHVCMEIHTCMYGLKHMQLLIYGSTCALLSYTFFVNGNIFVSVSECQLELLGPQRCSARHFS